MNRCTATCTNGRPCTARARPNRQYCFAHDPDPQPRRAAARQVGGYGKSTARRLARRMPATLKPVLDRLYTTLAALATDHFDGDPDDHVPELLVACQRRKVAVTATVVAAMRPQSQARRAP
jgi:hypothetical protein